MESRIINKYKITFLAHCIIGSQKKYLYLSGGGA